MSVKDFIATHSTGYAVVRTPDEAGQRDRLGKALAAAGAAVQPEQDGALRVSGLELPRISDIAYEAEVRLWELSPHQASLEEAYMRLTNGAVDYRSTQDPRQGLQQGAPYGMPPQGQPGWGWQPPQQPVPQPQHFGPPQGYGAPLGGSGARSGARARSGSCPGARSRSGASARRSCAGRRARRTARTARARSGPRARPLPHQVRQRGRPMTAPAPYAYQQPQFASQLPVEQTRLSHALRSEWTKIRSVRSTMWTLGVMIVLVVGINLLVVVPIAHSDDPSTPVLAAGLFGLMLGQMAILTLGVLVITSEYGTGMIRTTFTACPQRSRVLTAKAIVFFLLSFVTTTVACAITAMISNAVVGGRRHPRGLGRHARRGRHERGDRGKRLGVAGRDGRRGPVRGAARPAGARRRHAAAALGRPRSPR